MQMHGATIFPGMTHEPCESAVRAWARLMRAHQAALAHVEGALKAAGLPALAWYDVLAALEAAGDCGLRPFALFLSLIKENQHEDDNEYEEEKDGREDGKEFHI